MENSFKNYFKNHKYYSQYVYLNISENKKPQIFLEIFLKNIFPNFSHFSEFHWDNGDGDVGGDGDGDGQNFGCEIHRDYCQHI